MTNEENILQLLSEMNTTLVSLDERMIHVEQEVVKTNLTMEHEITKRLNSLSDGYILTHEKQYEMERKFEHKIEGLEKRIELLEIKAG